MNPATWDAGTWRGVFTAVMLLLFVGICLWAWSRKRHPDFEEAARLPLDDSLDAGPAPDGRRNPRGSHG
jgi:cytochrome c oxidase cbb3-type subunit 4